MAEYGRIFSASDIKKQLADANRDYNGRKTWEGMYSALDIARQQQENSLKADYASALGQAYATAYNTKASISGSNLGQGYKEQAMLDTDLVLEQAYNSYKNNYAQNVAALNEQYTESANAIDNALWQQANYTAQFANKPYEYLQYLFDTYSEGEDEDEDNLFLNDTTNLWKQYTTTNEDGETVLRSWDDIRTNDLFDENNELTTKGTDFYDLMFNYMATRKPELSFGSWLAKNDENLFNWSQQYNPYNYTENGSNLGTFKTLIGLSSTDEKYNFIERFGGFDEQEVDNLFNKFVDDTQIAMADLQGTKGYKSLATDLKNLTDNLGITEDLREELGVDLDQLMEQIVESAKSVKSEKDISAEKFAASLKLWEQGTAAGAALGGIAGSTGGGPVGLGMGALIGGAVGLYVALATSKVQNIAVGADAKKYNKQMKNNVRNAYADMALSLVDYAHTKYGEIKSSK